MSSDSIMIVKKGEDTKNAFSFEHLVFDIQHCIITYFVSSQDLYSLALVSRNINSLATPALYRHVKLLLGLRYQSLLPQMPGTFTRSLALAQESFAKVLLLSHTDKADLVRFLDWHVSSHGISPGQVFLELFPQLRNVRRLHITDAHPTHVAELSLTIPPLFPKLEEVQFAGITHLPFVMPILHSPHNLRSITFDAPSPHSIHIQLLRWFQAEDFQRLEKLSLWALCTSEKSKVEEIIEAWIQIFNTVQSSVKEVVLGFRSQRGRTCTKEEQHDFTMQLFDGLSSIFRWPYLRKLHLTGVSLPEKDFMSLNSGKVRTEIISTIANIPSPPFPAISQSK